MAYFLPKTKIGKISFWSAIPAFVIIYGQYIIQIMTQNNDKVQTVNESFRNILITIGLLGMATIIIAGITSIIAIIKYKDRAILLFLSALIGFFGLLFVLGEFLFPH